MNIAIPYWQDRVSPVFDVAGNLLLVTVDNGAVTARTTVSLTDAATVHARIERLRELGVDVLICGAVSWVLESGLTAAGIRVFARTCGEVEEVLSAWLGGELDEHVYGMPGCGGRRRRRRCGRGGGGRGPGRGMA